MKRFVYLKLVGCARPALAFEPETGTLAVDLDLKQLFHQGLIDLRGRQPRRGTNPLLEEYADSFSDDEELRFRSPGIAKDRDHRGSESHRLGRFFARGYLTQHAGFRWFVHISELDRKPQRGWRARAAGRGDTADWLVTKAGVAVVAEAKGMHRAVRASDITKWRAQVANTEVLKNGVLRPLNSWTIATRWVTTDHPHTRPVMYVEDPPTPGEGPLVGDELGELEFVTAREHTFQNLSRLGLLRAAFRVCSEREERSRLPAAKVMTWRCLVPALENLRFVGRVLTRQPDAPFWHLWYWLVEQPFMRFDFPRVQRRFFDAIMQPILHEAQFDGLDTRVLGSVQGDAIPELPAEIVRKAPLPDQVSFLSDGSLLAPMDLMEPDEPIAV